MKARTDQDVWFTGFLIGAHGEIVFGIEDSPTATLTVTTQDGRQRTARLLGFDRELHLAVGVVDGLGGVPLRATTHDGLEKEKWVVILGHDDKGRPEPHAGVVARGPTRTKTNGHEAAVVEVPGRPGSPILGPDGGLLGIAVKAGRRRTTVVTLPYLRPFLERIVLGAQRR